MLIATRLTVMLAVSLIPFLVAPKTFLRMWCTYLRPARLHGSAILT